MGLALDDLHRDGIAARVVEAASARRSMLVVNANAHMVVLSQRQPWLRQLFDAAEIAFCDGAGVQLATLLLRGRLLNRTTPPEWIDSVLRALGPSGSVFWLGGSADAVSRAAARCEQRFGVRTAGAQHGYFDAGHGSPDSLAVVRAINASQPSLLLVNMGMPRQELWLWQHWPLLDPVVAVTAGALVDHAAGTVRRPPRWVADLGLEWLIRLLREPRRLWRRYLLGLPVFGFHVLRYAVGRSHGL